MTRDDIHLRFEDMGTSLSGKTRLWNVYTIKTTNQPSHIGTVSWTYNLRCYTFQPEPAIIFTAEYLDEIKVFLINATNVLKWKRKQS